MPINLQTLFQDGGYKAGGVSRSPSVSSGQTDTELDYAKFDLEKKKFNLDKEKQDTELGEVKRTKVIRDSIEQAIGDNTTVDERDNAITNYDAVYNQLKQTPYAQEAVTAFRKQRKEETQAELDSMVADKGEWDMVNNYKLRGMQYIKAGDKEMGTAYINRANNLAGFDMKLTSGAYNTESDTFTLSYDDGQSQDIKGTDFLETQVDENTLYTQKMAAEMNRVRLQAKKEGFDMTSTELQQISSIKLDAWKRSEYAGMPEEEAASRFGYIDGTEIAHISSAKGLVNEGDFMKAQLSNPAFKDLFKEDKLNSAIAFAEEQYKTKIKKLVGCNVMHPSIRGEYGCGEVSAETMSDTSTPKGVKNKATVKLLKENPVEAKRFAEKFAIQGDINSYSDEQLDIIIESYKKKK